MPKTKSHSEKPWASNFTSGKNNSGAPNSIKHLMVNWASPKRYCKATEWQSDNDKNSENLELKLKSLNQTNCCRD